jgi:hypothetical protein
MNEKILTDRNGNPLRKGTIVKVQDGGHARITAVFPGKQTANLGSIFGKRILDRSIPVTQIYEDEASWYDSWSRSETYMSM